MKDPRLDTRVDFAHATIIKPVWRVRKHYLMMSASVKSVGRRRSRMIY